MAKTIKISVTCPQCSTKLAVPITENDLGTKKTAACPKCKKKFAIPISEKLASKFVSESTSIGGDLEEERTLFIEVIPDEMTEYQSFELTSDYYTIGRKNNSGPEHRPDVEVVTTDKKMSRKHAAIRKKGKVGFTLIDLGSKNGVILNGEKMDPDEEMYLSDGDTFCIGDTYFKVNLAERSEEKDSPHENTDLTR